MIPKHSMSHPSSLSSYFLPFFSLPLSSLLSVTQPNPITNTTDIESAAFVELQSHHEHVTFVLTLSQQAISRLTSAEQQERVEQHRAAFRETARKLQFHASFAEIEVTGVVQNSEDSEGNTTPFSFLVPNSKQL
jgi:hypothetical protein